MGNVYEHPPEVDALLVSILCVEFILDVLSLVHAAIYIFAVFRMTTFHVNLKYLAVNLALFIVVLVITRLILIPCYFLPPNDVAQFGSTVECFHSSAVNCFVFDLMVIFFERFLSTRYASVYEKHRNLLLRLTLVAIPWACFLVEATLNMFSWRDSTTFPIIMVASTLLVSLLFLILKKFNQRLYCKAMMMPLSTKYQLVENLKVTRCMVWVSFCITGALAVTEIYFVLYYVWIEPNDLHYAYSVAARLVDLLIAIWAFLFPFTLVLTHDEMRKRYFMCLCPKRLSHRPAVVSPLKQSAINEGQAYFEILQKQWS